MEITSGQVVDTEDHLVSSTKAMLEAVPRIPSDPCIYRVPYFLHCVNQEAYTPAIISIGPFHHGKPKLQAMEVHKIRYLSDFLKRRPDINLEDYVKTLRGLEERARGSYAESINLTSDDFIKIMLLDGCFIVELFQRELHFELRNYSDLVFKAASTRILLRRDLLLIENQLPFFLLEHLFNQHDIYKRYSFTYLTSSFFRDMDGQGLYFPIRDSSYQVKHFVDLLLQSYVPSEDRVQSKDNVEFQSIPSATKLYEAGVKFQKSNPGNNFLDIKFTNGVVQIPPLTIEDNTDSFFRNLIAMEQSDNGNTQYISHYVWLMNCIIESPNDVALLRKSGILDNWMGNNEEVSQLFNKLGYGVCCIGKFYYCRLCEDVNAYYNTTRHAWRAKLNRDYFNTPWAIISFLAAVLLLSLAIIQAVSSVISLKH